MTLRRAQFWCCGSQSGSFPGRRFCRKAASFVLASKKIVASAHQSLDTQPSSICIIAAGIGRRTRSENSIEASNSPPKPPLDRPALHGTVRQLRLPDDAFVLNQAEQLA